MSDRLCMTTCREHSTCLAPTATEHVHLGELHHDVEGEKN